MSSEGRYALYYFLLFGGIGAIAPFAALWLDHAGIEPTMIGAIIAAPSIAMLLTTVHLGRWADSLQDRRQAILVGNWVLLVAQMCLFAHTGFWVVVLVWVVMGVAMHAKVPITDAAALSLSAQRGTDFARIRMFGSVGFVVAILAAGYGYDSLGIQIFLFVWLFANVSRLLCGYYLPVQSHGIQAQNTPAEFTTLDEAPESGIQSQVLPRVRAATCKQAQENRKTELADPLYQTGIVLTLIGSAMINSSHALVNTFGILHWTQQGLSEAQASMAIAVGVVAEVGLMWWFKTLTRNLSARSCLMFAAVCGAVRWVILAMEPSLPVIFIAQMLHGVTFGVVFLASATFISRRMPEHSAARGQTLLATVTTACMATATYASGYLYDQHGGNVYWLMAVMCVVGMVALLGSYRYPFAA